MYNLQPEIFSWLYLCLMKAVNMFDTNNIAFSCGGYPFL
jgi:hypothetical protein